MDKRTFFENCIEALTDYTAELEDISGYVLSDEERESFAEKISNVQELIAFAQEQLLEM